VPRASNPESDAEALKLRIAGFSYDDIAKRRGYRNRSGAFKAVERALAAGAEADGTALEITRLDVLQRGLFQKAIMGDVQAALAVVKIIDQRSKLAGHYKVAAVEHVPGTPAAPPVVKDPVDDITARIAARRASAGS
jgi:hypothetical protein